MGLVAVSETETGNRIERRKREFQEKITRAALRLFEQQGVADTSLASIIKEADIAHKTFFNHFPTKDHLIEHIVRTNSEYAYSVIGEAFKRHTEPQKRIEYCLINFSKALEGLHPYYRELINYYLMGSAGASDLRFAQREKFFEVVTQILTEAREQKLLKAGADVETMADIIVGVYVSMLFNWSVEEGYPLVAKVKKVIRFINSTMFVEK